MLEVFLGVGLGLLLASNLALWLKLDRCYRDLSTIIEATGSKLNIEIPTLDGVRDEINETLQDFMQNLHVPNAADHLMGAAGQALQMWAHKKFMNEPIGQMLPQIMPGENLNQDSQTNI